ncbi:MAG TPA: hypothetical protein VNM37_24205, partial [Candidatus Dormibacteraeota bacterium]|nr:hypothetical protein [Candidatus Dormibacteraeota bacterium]
MNPLDRGSGGGAPPLSTPGSAGGGAIRLTALGALKLDGVISANGNPGLQGGGGGSGGSVWLTAGSISGNGAITANGGDGNANSGGGGGGRIAVEYGTNYFSGAIAARGGNGVNRGGAGTVYTKARNSAVGELVIDNGGQRGTNTSWLSTGMLDLTITGGAVVVPPFSPFLSNLMIGANSALVLSNQIELTVRGDALIQQGGVITADGAGYGPGQGPGAGRVADSQRGIIAGGGGYGGNGASGASATAFGGATYGSLTAAGWGSGGGGPGTIQARTGGAGGGSIQMFVNGTLTVLGRISANGSDGLQGGGGGSGGSINITAHALLGSGQISANGGMGGLQSGGGGGGRIAIVLSQPNIFNGIITAF